MVQLHHLPLTLEPRPERILLRPLHIATEPSGDTQVSRARRIVHSVRDMGANAARAKLTEVCAEFSHRHDDITRYFHRRFEEMDAALDLDDKAFTPQQRDLIGAYFSHEYSYASAALMNPSVVPHPDQNGLNGDGTRFVMSLRTVGEGHISAIAFREGTFHSDGTMTLDSLPDVSFSPEVTCSDVGGEDEVVDLEFDHDTPLSGTVLFPVTPMQSNGLEDLRLVHFHDAEVDEKPIYYGSYTAYSGREIRSELLSTRDFLDFRMQPMFGTASRNKGMAFFPRRIGGRYAVIGRQDNESLFYITSDDMTHWNEGALIAAPKLPWELVQIGNCGSPIEIDEGWLLLTHGVGAVRKYSIGAMLLDRDDPSKVLGRSQRPLLAPRDDAREGYVPNVVYTCGGMAVGRKLFLPHGVADQSVAFCWVDIDELVADLS